MMNLLQEGELVALRPIQEEDLEYFAKWEADPFIQTFFTMEKDRDLETIKRELSERINDESQVDLTIVSKTDNIPIGRIYLAHYDPVAESLDLNRIYLGDSKNRGKGLGKEALALTVDYIYTQYPYPVNRLTLDYYTGNEVAKHIYESYGFTPEGTLREASKKNGKYYDLHLLSLLKREWDSLKK